MVSSILNPSGQENAYKHCGFLVFSQLAMRKYLKTLWFSWFCIAFNKEMLKNTVVIQVFMVSKSLGPIATITIPKRAHCRHHDPEQL